MRKYIILTIITFLLILLRVEAQSTSKNKRISLISMKEAFKKGIINLKITGSDQPLKSDNTDGGIYFGKCMTFNIQSRIDSLVYLKLDCGTFLIPDDESIQRMIITHYFEIALSPKSKYTNRLYAMCTQYHKGPPDIHTTFQIGSIADNSLVNISKYIESAYLQNIIGQDAIWAYTDKVNINDLKKYGADDNSIKITKSILDAVHVITSLNKINDPKKSKNDSNNSSFNTTKEIQKINIVTTIDKVPVKTEEVQTTMTINRYFVYSGIGMIFILSITVVYLIYKRKKDNKENNIIT